MGWNGARRLQAHDIHGNLPVLEAVLAQPVFDVRHRTFIAHNRPVLLSLHANRASGTLPTATEPSTSKPFSAMNPATSNAGSSWLRLPYAPTISRPPGATTFARS